MASGLHTPIAVASPQSAAPRDAGETDYASAAPSLSFVRGGLPLREPGGLATARVGIARPPSRLLRLAERFKFVKSTTTTVPRVVAAADGAAKTSAALAVDVTRMTSAFTAWAAQVGDEDVLHTAQLVSSSLEAAASTTASGVAAQVAKHKRTLENVRRLEKDRLRAQRVAYTAQQALLKESARVAGAPAVARGPGAPIDKLGMLEKEYDRAAELFGVHQSVYETKATEVFARSILAAISQNRATAAEAARCYERAIQQVDAHLAQHYERAAARRTWLGDGLSDAKERGGPREEGPAKDRVVPRAGSDVSVLVPGLEGLKIAPDPVPASSAPTSSAASGSAKRRLRPWPSVNSKLPPSTVATPGGVTGGAGPAGPVHSRGSVAGSVAGSRGGSLGHDGVDGRSDAARTAAVLSRAPAVLADDDDTGLVATAPASPATSSASSRYAEQDPWHY